MRDPRSITVTLSGRVVGRLATTPERVCAFQYDPEYIRTGYTISPLKLPLSAAVAIASPDPFGGNFGVFEDSLPDGWGRLLQDRALRAQGIDPDRLTVLQRLALLGDQGRGALEYEPAEPAPGSPPGPVDLAALSAASARLLRSEGVDPADLATLVRLGGSSGGARPKVFYADDDGEWLVKFAASVDPPDVGEVEYECSLTAGRCGIVMPPTRLFAGRFFGTRRFDRTKGRKTHVVTAAGLLHADYRIPALDYQRLLALTRRLTGDMSQVEQMYRRMVFNVVVGNRDDHAKNFAFMMDESGQWTPTPAYDVLPSPGFNGQHTTTIGGSGLPRMEDLLAVGVRAGLPARRAADIAGDIRTIARHDGWKSAV